MQDSITGVCQRERKSIKTFVHDQMPTSVHFQSTFHDQEVFAQVAGFTGWKNKKMMRKKINKQTL